MKCRCIDVFLMRCVRRCNSAGCVVCRQSSTLIVREAHGTIALVVGDPGSEGAVDRDLQVVGAQPVAVGVGVGEEAALLNEYRQ